MTVFVRSNPNSIVNLFCQRSQSLTREKDWGGPRIKDFEEQSAEKKFTVDKFFDAVKPRKTEELR